MRQLLYLFFISGLHATTYNVGPSQPYTTLGAVPWYQLAAGDTVNIYYRSTCYAEKFLLSTQGTSWTNPITVQGVIDPATGNRPCITGFHAVQGTTSHDRWSGSNAQYSESLYVVGVSLQLNASTGPAYVVIQNLEITGAAAGATYTADDNSTKTYQNGVAGIRILNGDHVRVQNCYVHGIGGNGIFGKPNLSFPGPMADVQLLYNHFSLNGVNGSFSYHNTYIEADQALYQGNLYEPLVSGASGSDLKDRSAGTIIAYNRFNGSAARLLDLVDPQDGWASFGSRPYYGFDFVYGNIFETAYTDSNWGSLGTAIHYGGDDGFTTSYRNQTLSFYDNTFVSTGALFYLSVFQPELSTAIMDIRNNIFLLEPQPGHSLAPLTWSDNNNGSPTGDFQFGVNWVSPGWQISRNPFTGTSSGTANFISPGNNLSPLTNVAAGDFTLPSGSAAIGVAGALSGLITSNPQGGNYTPTLQYKSDQQTVARTSLADLGAFDSSQTGGGGGGVPPGGGGGGGGGTGPTFVSGSFATSGWDYSTVRTVSPGATPQLHDTIVVVGRGYTGYTVRCSDTNANIWTGPYYSTNPDGAFLCLAADAKAGTTTISITWSGIGNWEAATAIFRGLNNTQPVESQNASNSGGSSQTTSNGTVTNASTNALIMGIVSAGAVDTFTAPAGFALVGTCSRLGWAYKIVNVAQPWNIPISMSSGGVWGQLNVSLIP